MFKPIFFIAILSATLGRGYEGCNAQPTDIRAVNVMYSVPEVGWDGSISQKNWQIEIYYAPDLTMYRYEFIDSDLKKDGSIVNPRVRHEYFVFHKDSVFGQMMCPDPRSAHRNRRLPVDSLLRVRNFENRNVDSFSHKQPDSSYTDGEGSLVKVFRESFLDNPEHFILRFHYSKKLNWIPYSIAPVLDVDKKWKLWRISLTALSGYYPQYKITFPEREMFYEIKPVVLKEIDLVTEYFQKYRSM